MDGGDLMARKTSFYYSFLVLPAPQRHAIVAVWDFCRAVDDAIDEEPSRNGLPSGREAVGFWRNELRACYEGGQPLTNEARAVQPLVHRFQLPREAFADVIDGVAMDLDCSRYETFDQLFEYCRRVASAVGMICIRIFGCTNPASDAYALNLGVALQLTNILRDIKGDLARGRVYLPLMDLRAHGCTVDDLRRGELTPAVRSLLAFECDRARSFYQRAVDVRPADDRPKLIAAEIMRAVYFETLRRIERSGYDVFGTRTRVPRPQQAAIALRQWIWPS